MIDCYLMNFLESRFESYCEDKIHDVYMAIRVFNNFNYQKYLSNLTFLLSIESIIFEYFQESGNSIFVL